MVTFHRSIQRWLSARPWRQLRLGAPGLAGGLLALAVLAFVALVGPGGTETRGRYQRLATAALIRRDHDTARVAALRALSLANSEYDRSECFLLLSLALNGLGRSQEAATLLNAAAPENRPGSLSGHLIIARSLIASTNLDTTTLDRVEHHLRNALAIEPESPEIRELLGRFYLNVGRLEEARACLRDAYPARNEVALLLAIASRMKGDPEATSRWADLAVDAFRRRLTRVASQSTNTFAARLGWSQSLALRREFPPALAVLEDGLPPEGPCPAEFHQAIADLCTTWASTLPAGSDDERLARYRILEKGLRHAPLSAPLWRLLLDFTRPETRPPRSAESILESLLDRAQSPALLHYLLWTLQRTRGHPDAARHHLEQAYRLAPDVPAIANDMAMQLAFGTPAAPGLALDTIDAVLRQHPDEPAFRDTRGQVLVQLGRYRDAVPDLEFAVPHFPASIESRQALARARTALGGTADPGIIPDPDARHR